MAFRISGLIQITQKIQQEMDIFLSNSNATDEITFSNPKIVHLHNQINQIVQETENICTHKKATPADLPNPSHKSYLWLRFLSKKKWLLCHLHGLLEFNEIIKTEARMPFAKINPSHVHVYAKNSNYLFRCKQKNHTVEIEVNEGFICAPKEIKAALITSALGRKNKKKIQLIKEFTKLLAYQTISNYIQNEYQINKISHKGNIFDLEEIFNQLNHSYFEGSLSRARLSWSSRQSKRRLGYFHPETDAITISKSLDNENAPRLLIEYILYHEMLHKALGIKESNGRRYAHTREFKNAEKKFLHFQEAQNQMKLFCNSKK